MHNNCIFCRIIARELPASIVYEDEAVIAFMDLYPINPGHVLVVPKAHYASLRELPADLGLKVFSVVKAVEQALWTAEGIHCEGTNVLQNNGRSAWQDVFHVHFHVIPRLQSDNFKVKIPVNKPERAELDEVSARIKKSITL
ncbi:MAG: HIT family protein [Saprospiraceae bacterium]|nr:HIT family protein [Saprospiraceae bacterium]